MRPSSAYSACSAFELMSSLWLDLCVSVALWLVSLCVLPLPLSAPPSIEPDGEHDDRPGDDLLHPVRQSLLRAADLDDRHDRRARHRADDAALAAEEAAAADDHRRDDVELEAVR